MKYYYDYRFPIGNLTIEEDGHGICGIYFGIKKLEGEKKNTELIREAADRKSTRLNSSHRCTSRMPSSA